MLCSRLDTSQVFTAANFRAPRAAKSIRLQVTASQKGFGQSAKQKKSRGGKSTFRQGDPDWIRVASTKDFQGKQIKAVELRDKSIVALYQVGDEVFCSDANSTAFKFPLTNAKVIEREEGPAVEVALDVIETTLATVGASCVGTIYDLQTGKVLEWCPKNNLLRKVLGTIKSNQDPEDLKVYPAQVDNGSIYVKFS